MLTSVFFKTRLLSLILLIEEILFDFFSGFLPQNSFSEGIQKTEIFFPLRIISHKSFGIKFIFFQGFEGQG